MANVNPGPASTVTPNLQSQLDAQNSTALLTFATLPLSGLQPGVTAYTVDQGICYWNGSNWASVAGIVVNAVNVNPSNSATTNATNFQAAINTVNAAGGGTILLGSYSSPISINNSSGPGVILGTSVATGNTGSDTPYSGVRIVGSGWNINQSTNRAVSGTVLQGTSTAYPLIAYNYVDNTVDYANQITALNSFLVNCRISDLALDTCSYGIKIGALSKFGLNYSQLSNLWVSNYTKWGIYLENWISCDFQDIYIQTQNSAAFGGPVSTASGQFGLINSGSSLLNNGSGSVRRVFLQATGNTFSGSMRNMVIMSRNSAGGVSGGINDVNLYDITAIGNGGGTNSPASCTATAGSTGANQTHLTLSSFSTGVTIANFPVDMPVYTGTSGSGLGLGQYQTYFVLSNNGTYITIGNTQGSSSAISCTALGTDTLYTAGFPSLEYVGYQSGNIVQPCYADGVDVEVVGTTMLYCQNATVDITLGTSPESQGTAAGSAMASTVCGRNSALKCQSSAPLVIDFDSGTNAQSQVYSSIGNDTNPLAFVQGNFPAGFYIDRKSATAGLSLGGSRSNLIGSQLLTSSGLGGQAYFLPQIGMGQRTVLDNYNGSSGWAGYYCGNIVWKVSSNQSRSLPTVSTTANTTGAGNEASAAGNPTIGAPFRVFVQGTGTLTITTSQNFNNNAALTSITAPPGSVVCLISQTDGSTGWWVVEYMSPTAQFNADPTVSKQTPTTGFSITVGAGIFTLRLNPAGTLASGTITTPANPVDNQLLLVQSSQIVTALTISANTGQTVLGAPTTILANGAFSFRYDLASTTWYRQS